MVYRNREVAGRMLARELMEYRGRDVVVLGLPRGGVVVAAPVAEALGAPLDVLVARKIGAPSNPEFAIGAISSHGQRVLNDSALRYVALPPGYLDEEADRQQQVARARETQFRGVRPMVPLGGKTALLVDDGIATGMTVMAAIADLKAAEPARRPRAIVVAAPVMAPDTAQTIAGQVDRVVALEMPTPFFAVGQFYEDFTQTTDEEVQALLGARVG
jgi:putative phosphoribosyl transferase